MLTFFFSALRRHGAFSCIAAVLASLSAVLLFQHLEVRGLKAKLAQCRLESATLALSNRRLLDSVQAQNRAIESLGAESRIQQLRAKALLRAAHKRSAQTTREARRIVEQKTGPDMCGEMHRLLGNYFKADGK